MRSNQLHAPEKRNKPPSSDARRANLQPKKPLQVSEKRFRVTVDSLNEAVHIVDVKLNVVFLNRSCNLWCARLGVPEGHVGQFLFAAFPFLSKRVRAEYRRVIRTGRALITEEKTRVDGETVVTETLKIPISASGKVQNVITVMRDITKRRQLEESLRERERAHSAMSAKLSRALAEKNRLMDELCDRERVYREIYNATSEAIAVEDGLTGRFLEVNDPMVRMYGYSSKEELMACSIGDLSEAVPPYTQENAMRLHELVLAGSPQTFEWMAKKKSGELFNVEVSLTSSLILGKNRTLAVVRDISRRKRAEVALRQSEEQFRILFQNAPIGIGVADMNGDLLAYNDAMLQPGGYSRADIRKLGNVAKLYCDPREREEVHGCLLRQGFLKNHPVQFKRKDGSPYFALLSLTHTTFNGKPCIQAIVEDITERKLAELALQDAHDNLERKVLDRTAKLRALASRLVRAEEQERQRIAHVLHEDLQQMMTGVRLMLSDLRGRHPGKEAKRITDRISHIMEEAVLVTRTLCLDLRPPVLYEAGLGPALKWLAVDIKNKFGLVLQVRADARAEPKSKELRVFAFGAVRELLFNVTKHAGVRRAQVTMGMADANHFQVEVKDRGKGFDVPRAKSNGFGLFSLRELAESFGGQMIVRSTRGEGTRVTLTFPME